MSLRRSAGLAAAAFVRAPLAALALAGC
ncbi:MAG: hypothetical protein AVDCRST_MAG40-2206, partial [uncultured Gemmatimonadaceae bacterium]